MYDHVVPPDCPPDGYTADGTATQTGEPFTFNRLGIRVPAILVSPYIARGTVVPGPEAQNGGRIFEHACIPGSVTSFFLGTYANRTAREVQAQNFLNLLTDTLRSDDDCVYFNL